MPWSRFQLSFQVAEETVYINSLTRLEICYHGIFFLSEVCRMCMSKTAKRYSSELHSTPRPDQPPKNGQGLQLNVVGLVLGSI